MFNYEIYQSRGFTLVEVVVVLGILMLILSLGLFMNMESYHRSLFEADRDLLLALLHYAREQAIAGRGDISHGVHISPDSIDLFSGSDYDAGEQNSVSFERNEKIFFSGDQEILFEAFTGKTTASSTITMSQDFRAATITIDHEGAITLY